MKKVLIDIVAAGLSALLVSGCVFYDDSDYGRPNPSYEVAGSLYSTYIADIFRYAELVSFFAYYQEIRSDRKASEKLAEDYFGTSLKYLYYEKASAYGWGDIYLIDDGVFKISGSRYVSNVGYQSYAFETRVLSEGTFELIPVEGYEGMSDVVVSVVGETVKIHSFEYAATDVSGLDISMKVTDDGPLSMERCKEGNCSYAPYSGEISYRISGKDISDDFRIDFHDGLLSVRHSDKSATMPNWGY